MPRRRKTRSTSGLANPHNRIDWSHWRRLFVEEGKNFSEIERIEGAPTRRGLQLASARHKEQTGYSWQELQTLYVEQQRDERNEEAVRVSAVLDESDREIARAERAKKVDKPPIEPAELTVQESAEKLEKALSVAQKLVDAEEMITRNLALAQALQGIAVNALTYYNDERRLQSLHPRDLVNIAKLGFAIEDRLLAIDQERLTWQAPSTSLEDRQQSFADEMSTHRKHAIARWYGHVVPETEQWFAGEYPMMTGGAWFVEWVKENHRTAQGNELSWSEPFMEEMYLAVGSPWVERLIIEKPSQMGYTECVIALSAFLTAEIRVPVGMGFEKQGKMQSDMAPRIQGTFDNIAPIQRLRDSRREETGRKDTDSKTRSLTVGGTVLTLFYASVARKSSGSGGVGREASSSMSSVPMDVVIGDEVELWPDGTIDIAAKRQGACKAPTKVMRLGSTPGHEGGIVDAQVGDAGYVFMWVVRCPHCKADQMLHPFGNYLKPHTKVEEDGIEKVEYVDATGRPHDWHTRSPDGGFEERQAEAYVGCSVCGGELSEMILDGGEFRAVKGLKPQASTVIERKGSVGLRDFCEGATNNVVRRAALRLPRLASHLFNPGEQIGLLNKSRSPVDEYQQGLGIAISVGGGKIQLSRLQACVGLGVPDWCSDRLPDVTVLGVDQGKARNFAIVKDYWLPEASDSADDMWAEAFCRVRWWGTCDGFEGIEELARKYHVEIIGLDGEPEVQLATDFSRKYPPINLEDIFPRIKFEAASQIAGEWLSGTTGLKELIVEKYPEHPAIAMLDELIDGCERANSSDMYSGRAKGKKLRSLLRRMVWWFEQYDGLVVEVEGVEHRQRIVKGFDALECPAAFVFDQVHLRGDDFKVASRVVQGDKVKVISLHRTAGLDWVRDRIYAKRQSFAADTVHESGNENSLFTHYLSSDRLTSGVWNQVPGVPDHWFHADNFCEAALKAAIHHPREKRMGMGWG